MNTSFTQPLDQAKPKVPTIVNETGNVSDRELTGTYDDDELLALWERIKHESFDGRWIFERQYQRNIWYVIGRQWIEYQSRYGGWRDKRMAAWIPRPVTNYCKIVVKKIRAMFTAIDISVNVRPIGSLPANVAAAATATELAPLLHEAHHMDAALSEFDFWLLVTGNAFFHTFVDYDIKNGSLPVNSEQCQDCETITTSDKLTGAQPTCPNCQGHTFAPALDDTGEPVVENKPIGRPTTIVLSPLELSFPHTYTRFDEVPYVVRARWRTKRYYESQPALKDLVPQISWQKTPQDHSLSLYTSMVMTNDLGITPIFWSEGSGRGGQHDEGIAEFEVWMKPCDAYPDGLVFRILGEAAPIVVHLEETEALPGPLPYKDVKGNPLFPFTHATFEHVGGRILGSGALDEIIQKQDQLNQIDSQIILCAQRMANPVWLEPKGAEIQKLTGMPGLVIKWNPLTVSGNAKPERIPGTDIPASLNALRALYVEEIETISGTSDITKMQGPQGDLPFSTLQLIVERSQAQFASVFTSRGNAYKDWYKFALELEREFGPDERTKMVQTPARGWTAKNFQRTQLQGAVDVIVEDGSTTPKTNLGMRASMEHANQLGMLNMKDPDQQYEGLKLMGLTRMVPSLDINVQSALQKQQAFEQWIAIPASVPAFIQMVQADQAQYQEAIAQEKTKQLVLAQLPPQPGQTAPPPVNIPPPPSPLDHTPLKWRKWYNGAVHFQEFIKWANDDAVRQLMATIPLAEKLLDMHLQEIQQAMQPPPAPPDPPKISLALAGADLADPQVRQMFDMAEGFAPPAPKPQPAPSAGPTPNPGGGTPKKGGAGSAMRNSNANSAAAGNTNQPEPGDPRRYIAP